MGEKSRVLIIGGSGFLGKFIAEASIQAGHPTFVLVRDSTLSHPHKSQLIQSFRDQRIVLLQVSSNLLCFSISFPLFLFMITMDTIIVGDMIFPLFGHHKFLYLNSIRCENYGVKFELRLGYIIEKANLVCKFSCWRANIFSNNCELLVEMTLNNNVG